MNYPHRPTGPAPVLRSRPELQRPWTVTPNGRPAHAMPLTRRYEMCWMNTEGAIVETTRVGPAMPAFERAFAAMARGTLISTTDGPVAVEDLQPGTMIATRSGPAPLRWIGRILLPPANLRQDSGPEIFRLSRDAFGDDWSMPDPVFCTGARLVHRSARLAGSRLGPDVLVPVADFADGVSVTNIQPMSAVQSFHVVLDRHAVIEANGVAIESFHPGRELPQALQGDLLALFLSFFPFLRDLAGFGPSVLPRMSLDQIAEFNAA